MIYCDILSYILYIYTSIEYNRTRVISTKILHKVKFLLLTIDLISSV
nr:MAG TPA: hypothetical protein [Caudoviricetes sp.]